MRNLYYLFIIILLTACAKEKVARIADLSTDFELKDVKMYFDSAVVNKKNTLTKQTLDSKSDMVPDWSKSDKSRSSQYEVFEIPVSTRDKKLTMYTIGLSRKQDDILRFKYSFSRMIIYRNINGVVDSKIITYIPDESYINKYSATLSKNLFSALQRNFTGFLEYKNMEGKVTRLLRIESGDVIKDYKIGEESKTSDRNDRSTMGILSCTTICTPIFGEICAGPGGPGTGVDEDWQCWTTVVGENCIPYCDGGGDGPTPGGGDGNGLPADVTNNVTDPCVSAGVNSVMSNSKNAKGIMADIIHKFDANHKVNVVISERQNMNSAPGEVYRTTFDPNTQVFTAYVSLQNGHFANTTQESLASVLIHEFVHAYLSFMNQHTLNNHNELASNYVNPMAEYLKSTYGLNDTAAYGLAWAGVSDSDTMKNATDDTAFQLGDTGATATKAQLNGEASKYNDHEFFNQGTQLCP